MKKNIPALSKKAQEFIQELKKVSNKKIHDFIYDNLADGDIDGLKGTFIDQGTSRNVYKLDDNYVLKYDFFCGCQNKAEIKVSKLWEGDGIPRIIDYEDRTGVWLVAERADTDWFLITKLAKSLGLSLDRNRNNRLICSSRKKNRYLEHLEIQLGKFRSDCFDIGLGNIGVIRNKLVFLDTGTFIGGICKEVSPYGGVVDCIPEHGLQDYLLMDL